MTTVNERRRLRQEYARQRQELVRSYTQALLELGREYRRQRARLWDRRSAEPQPTPAAGPATETAQPGGTESSPPE